MPSLGVANRMPPKAEGERKAKRKMVCSPSRSPRRQPSPSEVPPKEKKERAAGADDAVVAKPSRRKPSAEALCTAATQFPLLISAAQGNLPMVKLLAPSCAAKCQLEQTSEDGFTPFMAACALGHADVVRFLLTLDINVECLDHMGRTPFMAACGRGHLAVSHARARAWGEGGGARG